MSKKFRASIGVFLALLMIAQALGDSCGLVLCTEADGTTSIETPTEQAACRQHQQAERGSVGGGSGISLVTPGCVDVPLSLSAGPFPPRINPVSAPRRTGFRLGFLPQAAAAQKIGAPARNGRAEFYDPSPPSPELAALRSVMLLI
jgi:hypothetical protein